ncbi:MAG: peptide chain release factor N(5)-glutamine methyltransferase [Gammaproteobacteria bacterium]|nr:peptide chain release factor N(5)-glutamine methyltransferase [Gammaproteobacteria bacterium]MBU1644794.1 peptide chain release factor N(5)-glutamine methyltransferase [Gammaproteobacteria bacterium]MBU1973027.1 peptide chain release factor N(5)-glutamine methyltransferase [Gammaproteobacteria bacterium]
MSIAAALGRARDVIAPAEARLLLRHALGASAAWLEAHRDDPLARPDAEAFAALVERRAAGEPVAYLLGFREFYGREFSVTPDVLIPRPETELLVDVAREKLGGSGTANSAKTLLDLGTGSGCVAITLALEVPAASVAAADISAAALAVAHANATLLAATVDFVASDWLAEFTGRRFDCIVANPPYVAAGDPHLSEGDLRFEPLTALACGADGLDAIRRIVADSVRHLEAGGWLFFEHGYDQAAALRKLLAAAGFADIEQHPDLAGIVRVSGGRWPGA